MTDKGMCLLLSEENMPLAKGLIQSPPDAPNIQVQVLEDKAEEMEEYKTILIVGSGSGELPVQCRLVRRRGERILLEKISTLDPEVRRNLRMPVEFHSFVYPIAGKWKGRRELTSVDLSCGGIAFYSDGVLQEGEVAEVVIPITEEPLLVRIQVLRRKDRKDQDTFYAAKFVDLCSQEEHMVRKAVFSVQLQGRIRHGQAGNGHGGMT